jgi:hypothetical protein
MNTECQYVPTSIGIGTKLRASHRRNQNSFVGSGKRILSFLSSSLVKLVYPSVGTGVRLLRDKVPSV